MSSRLLVLNELAPANGRLASAVASSQHAKLVRSAPDPSLIEPWQWALASQMIDAERVFVQDLAWLASIATVGRRLTSGRDVLWSLDAVGPRVVSLLVSVRSLADRLDPEHRVAAASWLDDVEPVRRHVVDGSAAWLAVVRPERGARRRLRRWRDHVGLVGGRPGAVIVADVPDRSDAWPRDWARERRRRADRLGALAGSWGLDAVCLPLSRGSKAKDERMARRLLRGLRITPGPADPDEVQQVGEQITWQVPIRIPRRARELQVGRVDEALVVRSSDLSRLIPLPPLLSRCTLVGAQVDGNELRIRAVPDARVWRSS